MCLNLLESLAVVTEREFNCDHNMVEVCMWGGELAIKVPMTNN